MNTTGTPSASALVHDRSQCVRVGRCEDDAAHAFGKLVLDLRDLRRNIGFARWCKHDDIHAEFGALFLCTALDGGPERVCRRPDPSC